MLFDIIVGARPNFMKAASILRAAKHFPNFKYRLLHTGQHFSVEMSSIFFEELQLPEPDSNFNATGETQSEQTGSIMMGYENFLLNNTLPDVCLVFGDVTSTLACSIVAKKANVKIAHIEAGIRSGDWGMPEEINRVIVDSIADYYFTTSERANENLRRSGVKKNIFFVGNTMIDTLVHFEKSFNKPKVLKSIETNYILLTLHRPSNVDNPTKLSKILNFLSTNSDGNGFIFVVHPRTRNVIEKHGIKIPWNITIVDSLPYLEFMYLLKHSRLVITDSGGVTEEATYLKIPCLTLRNSTERLETVEIGTNILVGEDYKILKDLIKTSKIETWKSSSIPKYWDGKTGFRIVNHLINLESD